MDVTIYIESLNHVEVGLTVVRKELVKPVKIPHLICTILLISFFPYQTEQNFMSGNP